MRPIKLTMTAFGPYKNTEIIDFRDLQGNSLFVISGNTGAGKTTIFDGICFALYGAASGQDRENTMMLRSDFASDEVHTAVELEFELKGRRYKILRQLGHVKKGNKSKTGEKYAFFELKNGREISCVDRQIVSEIDKKVEALMGLTQDQFKQIVMLPQGEFRKLLTSQTENKEEILRRLFKTEPYKRISERLKERKSSMEEKYREAKQMLDTYVQHIQAVLPERADSPLFHLLQEEYTNVHQIVQALETECLYYEAKIETDKKQYRSASNAHDAKQKAYTEAEFINKQFNNLEQKEQLLTRLMEQGKEIQAFEQKLKSAEQANGLQYFEKQIDEWKHEKQGREEQLQAATSSHASAEKALQHAQQVYVQEEGKKAEREKTGLQLNRFYDYLPIVKDIATQKEQLVKVKKEETEKKETYDKTEEKVKQKREELEKLHQQIEKLNQGIAQLPDKQEALHKMREQVKVLMDYLKLVKKQKGFEKDVKEKEADFYKQKTDYEKLESAWLNNQASRLASHLHDGTPCPVCGSLDHPALATEKTALVDENEMESAKKSLDEKDNAYRTVQANLSVNATALMEKEKEVIAHSFQPIDAEGIQEQLVLKGKKLKEEVDELEKGKQQLVELKSTQEKAQAALKQLEAAKEEQLTFYHQLTKKYETAYAVYEERLKPIPEEYQNLSILQERIRETEMKQAQLEVAWTKAQEQLNYANNELTKAKTNLSNAEKQLEETKIKHRQVVLQFTQEIEKSGFPSEEAYFEAKLDEATRQHLKEQIEMYKQQLATVKEQVQELQAELKDKQRVDLSALELQVEQLKKAFETALNQWNQSEDHLQEAKRLITMICEADEAVNKQEKELSLVIDLYDMIRGQNSQKVSFERYLQIEYLEQIVSAANQRLKGLSNGQYALTRSDRQESHGRQSGLALDVYDGYTGQTRDVKTLSGGEKFNASLCLALGMADVIQSFQGSISIETMFIDEGFGTLDEESLNKAIDTLVDLQQSGRMIGVISHVQELKTIFPAVLEVKKLKEGASETRFLVK
ncbi:SMC family ATPase [Virgibacillus sp. LDC-1]|uniref:AAA family ATPase n=1 Tax=Virgibacillus sp. LDC-1 TaxID=3039856 RepID=UPI0024DED34D|nr:SMC family ATPase [Virgibacillus sp. LDC-1]